MSRRLLALAAAAGGLTGLVALRGTRLAVVTHTVGGVGALALVVVVARRQRDRASTVLLAVMALATLTGVVWTRHGAYDTVVLAHLLTGVFATAGAVVLAVER